MEGEQQERDPRNFNPRSHCRERRYAYRYANGLTNISIHVPIAGNDSPCSFRPSGTKYFNPRSHCRERLADMLGTSKAYIFQSTFPLQGTTIAGRRRRPRPGISIHVPIAGNDCIHHKEHYQDRYFNLRSHCRERPFRRKWIQARRNFNPRSHCRERQKKFSEETKKEAFQSTFPLQGTTTWREN